MERALVFWLVAFSICTQVHQTHQQQQQQQQPPVAIHADRQSEAAGAPSRHYHQHHHHHQHQNDHRDEKPARKDLSIDGPIIVPDLPPSHYQFWLKNHPRAFKNFEEVCKEAPKPISNISDSAVFQELHKKLYFENQRYVSNLEYGKQVLELICSKISVIPKSCWGYENNCHEIYLMPECLGTSHGEAKSEQEQKIKWFTQADFGYILERRKEFSKYCAPDKRARKPDDSSLECSKHFSTCRGENLFLHLDRKSDSEKFDVVNVGGRNCDLQKVRIKQEDGRRGQLESWYNELGGYNLIDPNETCDITIDKQVFFVKINSSLDLYDYMGTLVNLYATMHLNNRFSNEAQIVIWADRLPQDSRFESMWYAFSRYPPISAGAWVGKKVCAKNFIFAMPPKMVDGLNNRKSLIGGCSKSGLYNAFHKHIVHRLDLSMLYDQKYHDRTRNQLVRVTILNRAGDELRSIVNVEELRASIQKISNKFYVHEVKYNSEDFSRVRWLVHNTEILIGVHGSGLSHTLFLPDWAALIELHDCGKPTYRDLARLRGLNYYSQKDLAKKVPVSPESERFVNLNESRLLDHDEFNNYQVDIEAFLKVFEKAKEHMLSIRANSFGSRPRRFRQPLFGQKSAQTEPSKVTSSSSTTTSTTTTSTTTTTTSSPTPPQPPPPPTQPQLPQPPPSSDTATAATHKVEPGENEKADDLTSHSEL